MATFRKQLIPSWFNIPQNGLGFDPSIFPATTLPAGKIALCEVDISINAKAINGQNPFLRLGFTHIAPRLLAIGGVQVARTQLGMIGDRSITQTSDATQWNPDAMKNDQGPLQIGLADFETMGYGFGDQWQQAQYNAWGEMVNRALQQFPDALLGCWAQGAARYRNGRKFWNIINGVPSGVTDLAGAAQFRAMYDNPSGELNPIFNTKMNVSLPMVYQENDGQPWWFYGVIQELEIGRLLKPNIHHCWSMWPIAETVDNAPTMNVSFKKPNGSIVNSGMKSMASPSYMWTIGLFGNMLADGAWLWGNRVCSENVDLMAAGCQDSMATPSYWMSYYGNVHYFFLGMYQAAQNKDIVEAQTAWIMPEFSYDGQNWLTGDRKFPSYCNFFQDPIIRCKPNANGSEWLVIAVCPYKPTIKQTIFVRNSATGWQTQIDLIGDYPTCGRFAV